MESSNEIRSVLDQLLGQIPHMPVEIVVPAAQQLVEDDLQEQQEVESSVLDQLLGQIPRAVVENAISLAEQQLEEHPEVHQEEATLPPLAAEDKEIDVRDGLKSDLVNNVDDMAANAAATAIKDAIKEAASSDAGKAKDAADLAVDHVKNIDEDVEKPVQGAVEPAQTGSFDDVNSETSAVAGNFLAHSASVQDSAQAIVDAGTDLVGSAKETTNEFKTIVSAHKTQEGATDTVTNATSATEGVVNETVSKGSDAKVSVVGSANPTAESDVTTRALDSTKETAHDLKESTIDQVTAAGEAVIAVVDPVKEDLKDDDAQQLVTAGDAASSAVDSPTEAITDAKNAVTDKANAVVDTTSSALESVKEKALAAYNFAKSAFFTTTATAVEKVEKTTKDFTTISGTKSCKYVKESSQDAAEKVAEVVGIVPEKSADAGTDVACAAPVDEMAAESGTSEESAQGSSTEASTQETNTMPSTRGGERCIIC